MCVTQHFGNALITHTVVLTVLTPECHTSKQAKVDIKMIEDKYKQCLSLSFSEEFMY